MFTLIFSSVFHTLSFSAASLFHEFLFFPTKSSLLSYIYYIYGAEHIYITGYLIVQNKNVFLFFQAM